MARFSRIKRWRQARGLALPLLVAVLGSACAFCAHHDRRPATIQPITIVFSTALAGNLEPCGCSPDQRGGIGHAAAAIAKIRQEGHPVVVLDGGDRYFASATPSPDPMVSAENRLKAEAMEKATALMRYDAVVLGARDAWAGPSFFDHFATPLLSPEAAAPPYARTGLVLPAGGTPVGVFAVDGGPDAGSLVAARAAALKARGAQLLVLLDYDTFANARALLPAAKAAGVSVVLAGRAEDPETHDSAELADSDPPLFTVRARGEALLRIDLMPAGTPGAPFVKIAGQAEREATLDALQARIDELRKAAIDLSPLDPMAKLMTDKTLELEARRAKLAEAPPPRLPAGRNSFTYAFIPMSPKLPQDPLVRAAIDAYNDLVSARNFAYAKAHPRACPRAKPGQASYSGDEPCIDCHEEAYDFWKTTPHAHAYADLVKRHRQYDAACVGCHVTGYEQPGGACDIAQTAGRENVQCEACHGPGSLHNDEGDAKLISREVPEKQCRTCHDPENSPHFNYKTYRPQILGPGHGFPLKSKPRP